MHLDYREIERQVTDLRAEMERVAGLGNKDMPANDRRDRIMALSGQVEALEPVARALRDDEAAQLRAAAGHSTPVVSGGQATGEAAEWHAYLRTGKMNASAALVSSIDGAGGIIIPEPLHAVLVEAQRLVDPILSGAARFDLTGGQNSKIELPVKATHGVAVAATETGARSEQNTPTFTSTALSCYEIYSDQRATMTSVDSIPDFGQLMTRWLYEDIYEQFAVDIATGADLVTEAYGLFSAHTYYATKHSSTANALDAAQFLATYFALPAKFLPSAVWLMQSATLAALAGLSWPGLQDTPLVHINETTGEATIVGKPVRICDSAPAVGDGAYPAALADLGRAYAVAEHRRPTVLVDDLTVPPYRRYYALARLGGAPWDPAAAILLKSDDS